MIVLAPVHVLVDLAQRPRFSALPGYRECTSPPPALSLEPFVCDPDLLKENVPGDRSYPWIVLMRRENRSHTLGWLERGADEVFVDSGEDDLVERLGPVVEVAATRRAVQRRMRASERSYRVMVDSALDVTTLLDDLGVILYESQSIKPMLGYEPQALVGRNALEFVHPGDRARILQLILDGRRIPRFEATAQYRFLHANGSWLTVESRAINLLGEPGMDAIVIVTRDISELRATESLLRQLGSHQQERIEAERSRIAREVHDVLGQSLTALKFDAARLARSADPADTAKGLETLSTELDRTISIVRRIASDLRPGILDDLGLTAAVEWLARRFEDRTGVKCDVAGSAEKATLDAERSIALFRVVQELLTNVARHANATSTAIRFTVDPGRLTVIVDDDGGGFNHAAVGAQTHLGLLGMRERLIPWGGSLRYESLAPTGTRAIVSMPI